MKITVGEHIFYATFAENPSADEFQELLAQGAITVKMQDYGGFEKGGSLDTELTRTDERITTEPGDVILYQGIRLPFIMVQTPGILPDLPRLIIRKD